MFGLISRKITWLNQKIGQSIAFLALFLVLVTVYDVTLRYLFNSGSVATQELEWHLFALLFILSAGYTHAKDGHVRVDLIYSRAGARYRALVNTIGSLLFLLPFCFLVIYASIPFVEASWKFMEGSPDPGGLPYRFIVKGSIIVGFLLLALQALAETMNNLGILFASKKSEQDV